MQVTMLDAQMVYAAWAAAKTPAWLSTVYHRTNPDTRSSWVPCFCASVRNSEKICVSSRYTCVWRIKRWTATWVRLAMCSSDQCSAAPNASSHPVKADNIGQGNCYVRRPLKRVIWCALIPHRLLVHHHDFSSKWAFPWHKSSTTRLLDNQQEPAMENNYYKGRFTICSIMNMCYSIL